MGILCIAISMAGAERQCNEKIVYRYIPKTFAEEQEEPVYVSEIFNKMFTQPSPWVTSINEIDYEQLRKVNDYFVSQA